MSVGRGSGSHHAANSGCDLLQHWGSLLWSVKSSAGSELPLAIVSGWYTPGSGSGKLTSYGNPGRRQRSIPPSMGRLALSPTSSARNPGDRHRHSHALYPADRSEEHTSELQSLMRISYAVFCLKKKQKKPTQQPN